MVLEVMTVTMISNHWRQMTGVGKILFVILILVILWLLFFGLSALLVTHHAASGVGH